MKVSKRPMIQGLLFAAPIVLSSTIAIFPSRAASLAFSTGSLTLENFNRSGAVNPNFPAATTFTATTTNATDGTVEATSDALAIAVIPPLATRVTQSSNARVKGSGRKLSGFAFGGSSSNLDFDTEDGFFRFDFAASLSAISQSTNPTPGERPSATSFAGFQILDDQENAIDFFEANFTAGNPFVVRSSPFIQFTIADTPETAVVSGFYARQFAEGTQLRVRGITLSTAAVTVPEPSMFAALVILPGWMGLKRRKTLVQEAVSSRDRQFE
ncbi:MAG: PEP-CTERM sorting domain-containing protein [Plectolyngbya sp. WJT66-NPBG17]|jgi:hypothetical protein|nr:PEP-CTERM sorting domain-containing protein [Plectolyngbya sp. WJT66-NPBG17]MBW4527771.1 PEP-CTERM sorting domain-containing protein [Phormidium tanganyikae FI6-MK23]